MNRCLSEKELLMLHAGEEAGDAQAHIEICLSCARNYRNLESDLGELAAALKRPAPNVAPPRPKPGMAEWSRGLRWSLAASAIVAAFVCGRLTRLRFPDSSTAVASSVRNSHHGQAGPIVMADNTGASTPAGYGLYLDDLIGSQAGDQDAAAPGASDPDDHIDDDSGAF